MNYFAKPASVILASVITTLLTTGVATARPCADCTPEKPPCGRACQP